MALNCPVVSASGSALPEAAGLAAEYFDTEAADAPEQLAATIERATGDAARRAELQRLGAARAAEFTWERAARQTLRAYQRAG
jgi:glycosyltransferase involved in cell wall biosynthesis